MSRFFTRFFSGLFLIFCFSGAFALDFGGVFVNDSEFRFRDGGSYINQTDSVTLWGEMGNSVLSFGIEGFYEFKFLDGNVFHNLDLNLARLNISSPDSGLFDIKLGRIYKSDLTGYILGQKLDGADFMFNFPKVSFGFYGGYTGLTNTNTTKMVSPSKSLITDGLYPLNVGTVIGGLGLSTSSLIVNQDMSFEVMGLLDAETLEENRVYFSLLSQGLIAGNWLYNASSTLALGIGDFYGKPEVSNLSALEFIKVFKGWHSSLRLSGLYASGFDNGDNCFYPVTALSVLPCSEVTIVPSSLVLLGIAGTAKPMDNLYAELRFQNQFDSGNFSYYGLSYSGKVVYSVFSDLQLSLCLGQHYLVSGTNYVECSLSLMTLF